MIEEKNHWDNIYLTKKSGEISSTQDIPGASLAFILSTNVDKYTTRAWRKSR
jgi:hypothetical protein